jgi:hypothetical protein
MFDIVCVNALVEAVGPLGGLTSDHVVPVVHALRPLIPAGGLRPGSVLRLGRDAETSAGAGLGELSGAGSLGLALMAGASQSGVWCAAAGLPELGVVAAAEMGAEPERLLLVDEPGHRWPDVVAALIEAVDLVLVRPPERTGPAVARRMMALARRSRCVLVVAGDWPGAQLRLRVDAAEWSGLGTGHGQLRGRRAHVVAEGRGAAGPGRRTWMWLPGPDGTVSPAEAPAADARPPLEVVA